MTSVNTYIATAFLVQIIPGSLGNLFILSQNLFHYFSGCRPKTTDLILRHITVANFLVILPRGIPETMAALGLEDFLSDLECRLVFYMHRVGRGVSMGSICLLSVFQAITISRRSYKWTQLNLKAQAQVITSAVLCWLLHMLLNIVFPVQVTAKWKNKNITNKIDFVYCSGQEYDNAFPYVTITLFSISDAISMCLMLWASCSMVSRLCKHKKQVQHIYRLQVGSGSSSVTRATHSILVLTCTCVHFYTISCIIQMCLAVSYYPSPVLLTTAAFISACFPTLYPFVLMSFEPRLSKIWCLCYRRNTVI